MIVGAVVLAGVVGVAAGVAWHPAIAPVAGAGPFAPELVVRGAALAAIGDCAVCHTVAGGRAFAGGRGVPTPFGVVYATNITPDRETGIGAWPEAAFRRAMRDGLDREGRHLYPVLPYPHFTRATDADIGALYAFMMTRPAVRQVVPANGLAFPMNVRAVLAGWNMLFLRPGPWVADPAHDAQWNRGAYLVEAVGHCGACHTGHNALGAEGGEALAGGEAEDWYAPALQGASPAAHPWTAAELETYLRTGFQAGHGAAAGPMGAVTDALAGVPAADVADMAAYIAALMPSRAAAAAPHGTSDDAGSAALFGGACAGCHAADAPMVRAGAPGLELGTPLHAPTSQGVVQIVLNGIPWKEGRETPYMPGFAGTLTDGQVIALAGWLRATYTNEPAWTDIPAQVARARRDAE